MITMTKKVQKQRQGEKIAKTRQNSHAEASKWIIREVTSPVVKDILNGLSIGSLYMPEFGWFERTGEKELTMIMFTENLYFKAYNFAEKLQKIVESMGWTFKYSNKMKYSGAVFYMKGRTEEERIDLLKKLKQNNELFECKKEELLFDGRFRKFVNDLAILHSNTDKTEKMLKKDKEERPEPYKLNRIILVFTNGKQETKRTVLKEAEEEPEQG